MTTVSAISAFLEEFAPARLAAEWDNVGLLLGDARRQAQRVMTCLTVTPTSVAEAVSEKANLIVAHHPILFRPVQRITSDTTEGKMLLDLAQAEIAVYSPHTALDSARSGINQRLAESLELSDVGPLAPDSDDRTLGAGRFGFPESGTSLTRIVARLKDFLNVPQVRVVGKPQAAIRGVGVACGSGGELLPAAIRAGCDCFVTGEASFHTCLEAEARGVSLILAGHFATERFAVERLAELIASHFPEITAWPCRGERDPLSSL